MNDNNGENNMLHIIFVFANCPFANICERQVFSVSTPVLWSLSAFKNDDNYCSSNETRIKARDVKE
jgi:hypothetical protein